MPRPVLPRLVAWVGAQAGFATVLAAWVGAQAGFATVLAAWVGAQAGFATVSGLGRWPGSVPRVRVRVRDRVRVSFSVSSSPVGRRKHNFTQLNRIKIHNFNHDLCGAP